MNIWLIILAVAAACFKYVWDIPTEDTFPHKMLYRCVYLYGVISYTAARVMGFFNRKSFAENYANFLMAFIPNPGEQLNDSDVIIDTTEFDGVKVRQYRNRDSSGDDLRPAFIFIHGGGYVLGSPVIYDGLLTKLCRKLGFYVVAIHYTCAPAGKFPRAFDDCLTACSWFLRNSSKFSVDANRVVIAGDSVGGQIAASVVQALCKDQSIPRPKAQVLMYPCLQFLDLRTPSYQRTRWLHGERPGILNHITMSIFLSFYLLGREDSSFIKAVSANRHVPTEFKTSERMKRLDHDLIPEEFKGPTYQLQDENNNEEEDNENHEMVWSECKEHLLDYRLCPMMGDLEGLPTTYLITCGVDILRDDAILYGKNLERAKVKVTHKHYMESFHGVITFPRMIIPSSTHMRRDLLAFLGQEV